MIFYLNKNKRDNSQPRAVLKAVQWYIKKHGFSPTLRELLPLLYDKQTNTQAYTDAAAVIPVLDILANNGKITRIPGRMRNIIVNK